MEFFNYKEKANHRLTIIEKLLPIIITLILILILAFFENIISKTSYIDLSIRYISFVIFSFFYYSEYVLRWFQNGIDRFNLPLHLCTLGVFLSTILLINKSILIYQFILSICVPGAMIALLFPSLNRSFLHFRYYTFMVNHCSLILVVVYYSLIYNYKITTYAFIFNIIIFEIICVIVSIFNTIYGTFYFYITFKSNDVKNTIFSCISKSNKIPYFFYFQISTLLIFLNWYFILKLLNLFI